MPIINHTSTMGVVDMVGWTALTTGVVAISVIVLLLSLRACANVHDPDGIPTSLLCFVFLMRLL